MNTSKENKKYRVLFVCLGNICRSPAGEGIFKNIVENNGSSDKYIIDSAGTAGYHIGELPDRRMRQHGASRGYTFDSKSRKFVAEDFNRFDIILAMDDNNLENILSLAPDLESRAKVFRMIDFLQKIEYDHIPDPYYGGASGFEFVLDLLEDSCQGLFNYLESNYSIEY